MTFGGGRGADTFIFESFDGDDTIWRFKPGKDKIDLSAVTDIVDWADLLANHIATSGSDLLITAGTDSIRIDSLALGEIAAGDFIF